jgi:hypothetical protein
MNKILAAILASLIVLVLSLTGCDIAQTTTAVTTGTVTTPITNQPTTMTTTPISTPTTIPGVNPDGVDKLVTDFIKNSATFKFDGVKNSISFSKTEFSPISSFRSIDYTVKFQTAHPGHGDRSGLMLAEVISDHAARIYYDQDQKLIRIAACDETWDLLKDKELPKSVSGIVISGGDTAQPGGALDVPHTLVFQVKQNDGVIINVSLKGYPPSPAGDAAMAKITLEFYAGSIQIGDQIYATGRLDKTTNTIVVGDEGGYIRTAIPKMQVVGKVLGGGDTTPAGLMDAPRKFVYRILKADGSSIDISYTVYPPSPAGDANNAKISLTFYNGGIQKGDYMMVYGTYNFASNSIIVADEGDLVKTYPEKP